jgi:signal transduction histidine kinase
MSKNYQVEGGQQIDQGVLRIFRICVLLLWGMQSLLLLTIEQQQEPGSIALFNWLLSSLYCIYLFWNWLQQKLGRYYLPIALISTSVGPVINQIAMTASWLHASLPNSLLRVVYPQSVYTGQLLPLLLPLLLICTQYGLRVLFCFTLGTTILSMVQVFLLVSSDQPTMMRILVQILARFLLFSVAGSVIVLLSAEKRKQQREMTQKNDQLTHYAIALEQLSVSRERNRIARELHDTLAHTLSALNVQLKALDILWESNPQKASVMIKQMQQSTHEGLQEARSALQSLRANPLEDLGLVLALKQLAEQSATWATIDLDLELPAHITGVSHEVELQMYRIAEEALHNITRHAHATHVSLRLQQGQSGLQLTIIDDGDGFDTTQTTKSGHYGLTGMCERAALIDATLELCSQPGQGTRVRLYKAAGKEKA